MESRLQSENNQSRTLSMLNIKCRASKNQSLFAVRWFSLRSEIDRNL